MLLEFLLSTSICPVEKTFINSLLVWGSMENKQLQYSVIRTEVVKIQGTLEKRERYLIQSCGKVKLKVHTEGTKLKPEVK